MALRAYTVRAMMVYREGVLERCITPVRRIVTLAALSLIVIRRSIAQVAGLAVRQPRVIHRPLPPISRAGVTRTALSREVIGRGITTMARSTIRQAAVIEVGRRPGIRVVAGAALPRIVIGRLVAGVARRTIR